VFEALVWEQSELAVEDLGVRVSGSGRKFLGDRLSDAGVLIDDFEVTGIHREVTRPVVSVYSQRQQRAFVTNFGESSVVERLFAARLAERSDPRWEERSYLVDVFGEVAVDAL
jgi:hypothetical protein